MTQAFFSFSINFKYVTTNLEDAAVIGPQSQKDYINPLFRKQVFLITIKLLNAYNDHL